MTSSSNDAKPYHHGDLRSGLLKAALELVKEEQNWDFSLREVARRAGVSHNAPYNHFGDKRQLLAAVATIGFDELRAQILQVIDDRNKPDTSLVQVAQIYVSFATGNVALYRLMFGAELAGQDGNRPADVDHAGRQAKSVLAELIREGINAKIFTLDNKDSEALEMATLACWSALHGIATLIADAKIETSRPHVELVDGMMHYFLNGLRSE
ncbi:hypothetical protein BV921_13030 [Pectobacterium odoriferum]|uniref:TetR/AcrR family transcriptional regulator n=1 Tax=Pectobacterium odoriferum TaxID=78398 RepID=UPI000CCFF7FF|nr:TetR/AcrR family transcriptional regulator [Pectobacterium odoriferum]POD99697.1 hypothetical protein BVY05_14815 [Pectobacterium odoriferum]POE09450.1 hypothetical protein BV921_13030 [Pectobacterium odoriferum]POE17310.1 hypothetical protein BV918_14170 [Pectobacterium odoriferum]POE34828.1 hypothetical protein BV922_12790 [Pectobacterium odoriferum]